MSGLYEKLSKVIDGNMQNQGLMPGDVSGIFEARPKFYSNSDETINEYNEEERDRKFLGSVVKYGLSAGALYAVKKILEKESVQRQVKQQFNLTYLSESIRNTGYGALDIFGGRITLTNMAIEAVRRAEELSPFSILRTFHMSHFLQPFATKDAEVFISSDMIRSQTTYYEEMFKAYGKKGMAKADYLSGFIVRGGKAYNEAGDVLIENVRVVASEWGGDTHDSGLSYTNRILRRHIVNDEAYSAKSLKQVFDFQNHIDPSRLTLIAGNSQDEINRSWIKSAAGVAVNQGFNMVNEPLGFLNELAGTALGDSGTSGRIKNVLGKLKINPSATKDSSVVDLTKGYIKHGAIKTGVAVAGFYALDNAAKVFGPENSGFEKGILEGLATTYAKARLMYAEVVGDSFSEYKEEQEYVAPKSTNLLNLAGLPLAGAMLGGTIAYSQRMLRTATTSGGFELAKSEAQHLDAVISPQVSKAVNNTSLDGALGVASRGRRYATRGALVGALLAAPFIPGALIGDNSQDVKEEYWGDKEVAIRSNRYWFSSSSEYEGQGVKYFARNWYQRLMADSEDKVLYGDQDTKEDLNPFLSPFDYLRNPYRFEEMHKEDMPYPVWGMDVSYGGWAGKIFERTVGQIIKPDMVNPEIYKLQEQTDASAKGGGNYSAIVSGPGISFSSGEEGTTINVSGSSERGEDSISVPVAENRNNISLIEDGLLAKQRNLQYTPDAEAVQYTYNAALDFIGLKGWAVGMISDDFGLMDDDYTNQLARSGEITNVARNFMTYNAGGLFGAADVMRRIIPMSSDAMYDRSNPIKNSMAASWLPNDSSSYYRDFSSGNYYGIERGYERMPGEGYAQYYEHLRGVNPEDYSDIDKLRVLADVAYSSNQYYTMMDHMATKYANGEMSAEEAEEYSEIYEQTQLRAQKKTFYEYKTDEDLEGVSTWGKILNAIWEPVTHNAELPTEKLTFFRPAGKLLHQRTAIEDYQKTQILGTDAAMWDRPIDHFINPFVNETVALVDEDHIPVATQEKRNVDSYFDSLEYYKQMKVYRENIGVDNRVAQQAKRKAQKTIRGAIASGLDDESEILGAYAALSGEEKPYFTSFVNAKESDREQIAGMLEDNTSNMYQMLWRRKDAVENGMDVREVAAQEEQDLISENSAAYRAYQAAGDANKGISFSEYLQEQYAYNQIQEATGVPDEEFIGWDHRIDIKDVKLRTLMIGKDDIRKYGYWETDERDLKRQLGILAEDQVTTRLDSIKRSSAEDRFVNESRIKNELYRNGINARSIQISNIGMGDFDLSIQ